MIAELKKLWHPIHFVIVLIVIAGTVWSLYGTMYTGAPFLREGMIAAWADVLEKEEPREYVTDQCNEIDSMLMELQSDYMQSDSDAEKKSALSSLHEMERMEGRYTNSLPRDFLVLSRIQKRVNHIASLEEVWENEQAILKRAIKRKGAQDESTKAMRALSERYAALSVPEYANIDPYESLIRWNASYAYIILIPIMWIVAQSLSIEKKTGMKNLICSIAKSPRRVVAGKVCSVLLSACCVVLLQFLAGLGVAVYMAGGMEGLRCSVQAIYGLEKCCWSMPIDLLLFFQWVMQSVLAVFVAACTLMVTSYLQDEWAALPILLAILITPNVLYMLLPEALGLDIVSIVGVMKPVANNSLAPVLYAVGALLLSVFLTAHTCSRFVRRAK